MAIHSQTSDEELMRFYKNGDSKVFSEIFKRHKRSVYNYILRFTNQKEESEEIFQEVFIRIHRAAALYEPTAKFKTWMFTIVRNLCIDFYRKKKLRKQESLDAPLKAGDESSSNRYEIYKDEKPNQEAKNSDVQIAQMIDNALQQINEDQREVFLMREKGGLKFEEIAEVLGVSVNTVKSRMRYAMEALRKIIESSRFKDLSEQ
ncbi:MAG: RNA polymerase sigma factor [Deltaproteobacteria bacterium]|nr:RNA polymerase sigma factor [Deltaproteobacteria bacterium]